jgi:hypothetical protein
MCISWKELFRDSKNLAGTISSAGSYIHLFFECLNKCYHRRHWRNIIADLGRNFNCIQAILLGPSKCNLKASPCITIFLPTDVNFPFLSLQPCFFSTFANPIFQLARVPKARAWFGHFLEPSSCCNSKRTKWHLGATVLLPASHLSHLRICIISNACLRQEMASDQRTPRYLAYW